MNETVTKTQNALTTYFKGVKTEWGKITWPEKQQVVVETFFVIAIVFVFTVFLFCADKIFEWLLSLI